MKLAIFDLDHTLLDIDSDYNWGKYIVDNGLCGEDYQAKNNHYFQQYLDGILDPTEYCEFVASFLASNNLTDLTAWRDDYIQSKVIQHIRPLALQTLKEHQQQGHEIVISSATNDFIVTAIAQKFGVPSSHVLSSKLAQDDNGYTGKVAGLPNFTKGKVVNLQAWLADKPSVEESWAYSDSFNDIPLLEFADHAFAVSADEKLNKYAQDKGWQILDWSL